MVPCLALPLRRVALRDQHEKRPRSAGDEARLTRRRSPTARHSVDRHLPLVEGVTCIAGSMLDPTTANKPPAGPSIPKLGLRCLRIAARG